MLELMGRARWLAAVVFIACSASKSTPDVPVDAGLAYVPDSGNERVLADASAGGRVRDAAERDAETDGGPGINVFPEGDFELDRTCDDGLAPGSTAAVSTVARSGAKSCQLWKGPPGDADFLLRITVPLGPVGARYHAEAWVRTAPNANGGSLFLQLSVGQLTDVTRSAALATTDTWQLLTTTVDITASGATLVLLIDGGALSGGSFSYLVDDIAIVRER
jgi:hypothetical protein